MSRIRELFSLKGRIAIITGGAGLLGVKHAEIISEAEGIPILLDINFEKAKKEAYRIYNNYKVNALGLKADVTNKKDLIKILKIVKKRFGHVDILINNAALNPKIEKVDKRWTRFEEFSLDEWNKQINVGLTGAFLCSQIFGGLMAQKNKGVILNMASDLAIIAPDQRIYRKKGLSDDKQAVKPVTYSVIKSALLGLTRYLATYWAEKGVRVNALLPAGVENNQSAEFIKKLTNLIPMGRMARPDEYKGAVLFLVSDASSYMTGSALVIDGGRTCW